MSALDRFHRRLIFACYLFGPLLGGIILCTEKENEKVYFHALQSFFFHILLWIVYIPVGGIAVWVLLHGNKTGGYLLMGLGALFLAVMALFWISLLYQALRGRNPRLPWLTARLARARPRPAAFS